MTGPEQHAATVRVQELRERIEKELPNPSWAHRDLGELVALAGRADELRAALRTVAAQPHAPIDGVGVGGAVHVYVRGHPMGCPICQALDAALDGVQADKQPWGPDHPSYDEMGQ